MSDRSDDEVPVGGGHTPFGKCLYDLLWVLCRTLGVSLLGFRSRFVEPLPKTGPLIVLSSHQTFLDPLLLGLTDPKPFPGWMSEADLDYYESQFKASGLRGPINRYRNHERDHAWLTPFMDTQILQPAFFVSGTKDMAFNMMGGADPIVTMRTKVPNLQVADVLDGCGHWTQQERPDAVNARLIPWLKGLLKA
jgi:pimeloyl-ACP methyl ester carboxylesterase